MLEICPLNERELLNRARKLAGLSLGELAKTYAIPFPQTLLRAKGFVGQLLELALGASAKNQSLPDFPDLGIELKTLPIDSDGHPRESTYVCTAPTHTEVSNWQDSRVRQKLLHVLWIPIEADPKIPLPERRIGTPLLWHLPPTLEHSLQQDWEELVTLLRLGQEAKITARLGTYLQIRPKAAHSRVMHERLSEDGDRIQSNPRGFYLRTLFTRIVLEKGYC
ncbi:MAG: DNA mismatch repair endonuclease MutH [Gammaproteobacteria bacterium]|nr:DNA mismatch repair endonuclease MutH [Gammaproteobacteria bacterium]MBP9729607.1 DNA mismatch repair endonuclease MutH [Gammaproteobacteria bacterium]